MSDTSIPPPGPEAAGPEPESPGLLPAGSWGSSRVLAGLAVLLLATLAQVIVISAFDPDLDSLGTRLLVQSLLAVSLVAVAFLMVRPGQFALPAELGLRRPLIGPFKLAALAYLAYIACAIAIAVVLQPEQEDVTEELGYGESAIADVVVGILIVGVAPFTEELFFRGFMFAGLRRNLPFAAAAIVSAGVWGLFHYTGPGTWGVVVQLAAFGVILAWLYERTGSLWPTVAVHAINNALAFAILTS